MTDRDAKRDWLAEKCGWERFADCGHWTPPGADEYRGTALPFENTDSQETRRDTGVYE